MLKGVCRSGGSFSRLGAGTLPGSRAMRSHSGEGKWRRKVGEGEGSEDFWSGEEGEEAGENVRKKGRGFRHILITDR